MPKHISVSIKADRPYVSLLGIVAFRKGITTGELVRQILDRDRELARDMETASNLIANFVESNQQKES